MVFAGLQTTEKLLEPNLINVFDSSIIFLLTFDCLGGIAKSLREIKWEICARVWACTVYFCAACSLYLYQWGCEWTIVTNKGIKSQLRMQTGATFSTVCCSQLSDEIWNTNTTALLALLCLPSWAEPGQNSSFFLPPSSSIYPQPCLPSNPPLIRVNELLASQIKWKQHAWMSGKQRLWELAVRRV